MPSYLSDSTRELATSFDIGTVHKVQEMLRSILCEQDISERSSRIDDTISDIVRLADLTHIGNFPSNIGVVTGIGRHSTGVQLVLQGLVACAGQHGDYITETMGFILSQGIARLSTTAKTESDFEKTPLGDLFSKIITRSAHENDNVRSAIHAELRHVLDDNPELPGCVSDYLTTLTLPTRSNVNSQSPTTER